MCLWHGTSAPESGRVALQVSTQKTAFEVRLVTRSRSQGLRPERDAMRIWCATQVCMGGIKPLEKL